MTDEHDVSPFVFKGQYNDESAYIPYEEIANRDQADSKSKINNDQVLPLPEIAKESKGIKVGSKVLINTKDSSIECKKELHNHIRTVVLCDELGSFEKMYRVSGEPFIWLAESDLILMDDSTPTPAIGIWSEYGLDDGQDGGYVYFKYDNEENRLLKLGIDKYNKILEAYNGIAGIKNSKSDVDNFFEQSLANVQSVAKGLIEEKNMFDIDKYNKNYTEINIQTLKDCKDKLANTDKPIDKPKNDLSVKLVSQITYSDKEIAECFANLKVGDEIKIKDKKYCGLWGKYNSGFCDKWVKVTETCPHNHYIAAEDAKGDMALIDLFVVQIMAIKDCAISEIKNPTVEDFNNLKPGDKVLLKSIEECHAEDWYDEFKVCCDTWVTIGKRQDSNHYISYNIINKNGAYLTIAFNYIAAIRKA